MTSGWKDFVTNALLGTERGTPLDLPEPVAALISNPELARLGREARFLTRAGAYAAWLRADWRPPATPGGAAAILPPAINPGAEAKPETPMGRDSAAHLRAMLAGTHAGALLEWLEEAARLRRPAPPELLPALLDTVRRVPDLTPLILAVGGRRAAWLAGQNPAWGFAVEGRPELWATGTRDQRLAIFRTWRLDNPAHAREQLAALWKSETPEMRAAFVEALEPDLADEDIPFLETTLDDRSREVRRHAANLLAFLPESPLVKRMTARADALVTFKRGGLLRRASLSVSLPDETDPTGVRDGLDPRAFGLQVKLSARQILLIQILAAVPLRHWTDTCQLTPAAILKAVEKDPNAAAAATGWAIAAVREENSAWAGALLDAPAPPHAELLPGDPLLPLIPEDDRVRRLLPGIHGSFLSGTGRPGLPPEIAAVRAAFPRGFLPERLTRELLDALRRAATSGIPWHQRAEIEALLARVPPPMLTEAAENWPTDRDGVAGFVDFLRFRQTALASLSGM